MVLPGGVIAAEDVDPGEELPPFTLDDEYRALLQKIHGGTFTGIDEPTTISTARKLMDGVFKGYGGDFVKFKYDQPNYDKLSHLERNVYQFSAAKNYQQGRDLTDALRDGDRVVPFREFEQKAEGILNQYQGRWLHTEYRAAVAGSQMAAKWVDAAKHPESLMQYRTVEDMRVREEHRALNRITRPVNDPFWSKYYPPNGWNCRCTAVRVNRGTESTQEDVNRAMGSCEPQKGFTTNLAEHGFVFPKNSPYFIGCPEEFKDQALRMLPYDRQFKTIHEDKSGGSVQVHLDYKPNPRDHQLLMDIAHEKAAKGHTVQLMPPPTDKKLRALIVPDAKGAKNADLRIDGHLVEVKQPEHDGNISSNLDKAYTQANRAIIQVSDKVPEKSLSDFAHAQFGPRKNNPNWEWIEFRRSGEYIHFDNPNKKE